MITVRFNLGRGDNYQKWKITLGGDSFYFDPDEVFLRMEGCKLVNQKSAAQKIWGGSNKTVCAWVKCKSLTIHEKKPSDIGSKVCYNPRLFPFWMEDGENVDGKEYDSLVTCNRNVYTTKQIYENTTEDSRHHHQV